MEEYIILGLLIVVVALITYLILIFNKNKKNENQVVDTQKDIQNELKVYLQKEYGDQKVELTRLFSDANKSSLNDLNAFKDSMLSHIERQMKEINEKVDLRLGQGFEKTQQTFVDVVARLSKIDEAQKKIEELSGEVVSLNVLLTDKKTRGIFGEVQLYQLLSAVLGDNKQLYEKQKTMSNGFIADAVVHSPEPLGTVAIDSKFPLDNYKRMVNRTLGESDRKVAEKDFINDVKKHINDIKNKYIIFGETGDQAFMFVPAEAIFAEIAAYHEELIEYAAKSNVWITSPTTLISMLTMIQMVVKNYQRDEQAQVIITELNKLGEEFKRYFERWEKLKKSIDSVSKNAKDVYTTSHKINKKFQSISETKFDQIAYDEDDDESFESDEELE
jgi:DNA recombination protein RmuC